MAADILFCLLVPVVLILLALVLFYVYCTCSMNTWSKLGVVGPKPVPIFGNIKVFKEKGLFKAYVDWSREYGKVYGIYYLRHPVLVTTDLDIIREAFIKDFGNFSGRGLLSTQISYPMTSMLVFTSGDTWRRQRLTLTPTFTANKLKLMAGHIRTCCDNLVTAIESLTDKGKPMNVKELCGAFTLDVIAGTSFGLEVNSLADQDHNEFLQSFLSMSRKTRSLSPVRFLTLMFPALVPVLSALGFKDPFAPNKERAFLMHTIKALMKERKSNNTKLQPDLLQLMLDAECTEAEVKANPQVKRLTPDEVVAQGLVFFIAGYDTVSTALQYLIYLLAINPDKQEKLFHEIIAAIGSEQPSYENVSSITYLDSCIHEALRIFPPAGIYGRTAEKARTIKDITIPAGTTVIVSVYGLTRDEELFPEAEKFIPERFQDESHHIPSLVKDITFGAGPRQCIGLRLALYEIKMVMAYLITRFKFVKIPQTPDTVRFMEGLNLTRAFPEKPLVVGTERRLQSS